MIFVLAVLFSPRRWALLVMVAGVMFLTENQQIEVAGLNMFAVRFLELAGFVRVMARREFSFRRMNGVDKALLWLYGFTTVVLLLRSGDLQAYQIGVFVDAFLSYFTFRGLLNDAEDFRWFLRSFFFLLVPYALLILSESITQHNPFTILGASPEHFFRKGRPRCFGSFRQPDTLGMFAAGFIPLFISLACSVRGRKRALVAVCFCLLIVWAANSGGAAAAALTGLGCWGFWSVRTQMRKVRWGIVAMLVLLALVMKAPIWFIFSRVSDYVGGDGYHRSYLIDVSIRHLGEWWFAGMSFLKTKDWFPYTLNSGVADITNQYIAFGITAGVGAIALFILLLTRAFSNLGKALALVRSSGQQPGEDEFLLFGMGVMLVIHIIDWFGICYFDQMYMIWFMELAAISSVAEAYLAAPVAIAIEEPEMGARQSSAGFNNVSAPRMPTP